MLRYTDSVRGPVIIFGGLKLNRENRVVEIVENETGQKLNWKYLSNISDIRLIEPLSDKKSIGIAQVKEGIGFLAEKPFKLDLKILIISPADLLTNDAQNALLKTLEEPPKYALVLMLTKSENTLIPTVISRCKKVRVARNQGENTVTDSSVPLQTLLSKNLGELLDWVEEFSKEEKDTIIETLENWVVEGEEILQNKETMYPIGNLLEKIYSALEDLQNTNVTTRSCLENLFFGG